MPARVPTTREVVRGAAVNIVLKADQRTGRTVSGTVQDVLTSGNHPRGIKVRLSDGRVGRVQTMAHGGGPSQGGSGMDGAMQMPNSSTSGQRSRQRADEEWQAPPQGELGLDAYVREAKPKKQGRGHGRQTEGSSAGASEESSAMDAPPHTPAEVLTCPVCGEFEGDEAAVSHHVAGHFDT